MTRSELLNTLESLKPELDLKFGIHQIALFGSYARDEATSESDIDIAIVKMDKHDFFLMNSAKEFLKEALKHEVDLGMFSSMKTFIKNKIEKEFIYV